MVRWVTLTPPKKVEESLELDEAKTVTLVAKKKGKTVETVKKVSAKERKTVEMLMKTARQGCKDRGRKGRC